MHDLRLQFLIGGVGVMQASLSQVDGTNEKSQCSAGLALSPFLLISSTCLLNPCHSGPRQTQGSRTTRVLPGLLRVGSRSSLCWAPVLMPLERWGQ